MNKSRDHLFFIYGVCICIGPRDKFGAVPYANPKYPYPDELEEYSKYDFMFIGGDTFDDMKRTSLYENAYVQHDAYPYEEFRTDIIGIRFERKFVNGVEDTFNDGRIPVSVFDNFLMNTCCHTYRWGTIIRQGFTRT